MSIFDGSILVVIAGMLLLATAGVVYVKQQLDNYIGKKPPGRHRRRG